MANHKVKFISFDRTKRIGIWTHPAVVEVDGIKLNAQVTLAYMPNYKNTPWHTTDGRGVTMRIKFENPLVKRHPDYKHIRKQTQEMFMSLWGKQEIHFTGQDEM